MKFEALGQIGPDLGIIVKPRDNADKVVFFNEIENAACYKLDIYRIEKEIEKDCFVRNLSSLNGCEFVENYIDSNSNEIEKIILCPSECVNELYCSEKSLMVVKSSYYYFRDSNFRNRQSSGDIPIKLCSFDDVRFVTTLIASRNQLYFLLDFLPIGSYVVVLSCEDRQGNVVARTLPYAFKCQTQTRDVYMTNY